MNLARKVLQILSEMPFPSRVPTPGSFTVDYYAITPNGSRGRYRRTSSLTHMPGNAQSETAVRSYLQQIHPLNDIQIISLKFG